MPNKTIYLDEENLAIWNKAAGMSPVSMSQLVMRYVRYFVEGCAIDMLNTLVDSDGKSFRFQEDGWNFRWTGFKVSASDMYLHAQWVAFRTTPDERAAYATATRSPQASDIKRGETFTGSDLPMFPYSTDQQVVEEFRGYRDNALDTLRKFLQAKA